MEKKTILLGIFLTFFASCTDDAAFQSCKEALTEATLAISGTETLVDARRIDEQVSDTLYKYGRSKMSRERIDEIKRLKSVYEKKMQEHMKYLKTTDTIPARRIVEMPGIGLVEVHTPPEV